MYKKLVAMLILALPIILSPACKSTGPPPGLTRCLVTRVIDGDTIDVSIAGRSYRVRYIGIDTPETKHPKKPVEWMGKEATAKNQELVGGKLVRLEKDVSETDKYGRLLRYVWVSDLMVNAELVRLGFAKVSTYPPDVKYQERFLELQRKAMRYNRGLWSTQHDPDPCQLINCLISTTKEAYHVQRVEVAPTRGAGRLHSALPQ